MLWFDGKSISAVVAYTIRVQSFTYLKDGKEHSSKFQILKNLNFFYKFQDCGIKLDSKKNPCYPHKNDIFCKPCNRKKFSSDEDDDDSDENWKKWRENSKNI